MAARLVARVTLPRELRSAGVGRRFVTSNLLTWLGDRECVYDAEMIVSEMIGNAVHHGMAPFVFLTVSLEAGMIGIDLGERSPELAETPSLPPLDAEDGRGLFIIEALSVACGMRLTAGGKVVWATLGAGSAHVGLDMHAPGAPELPLVPLG